jgi:hypothetical protein
VKAEDFKAGVREHLERLSPQLTQTLAQLVNYPFLPEIDHLHFEVFSDGFTQEFPVNTFFLDADGDEFFVVTNGKAEYPCDVNSGLLEIEHVFPIEWERTFTDEDPDLDAFGLAATTLIPWFADSWMAAGGGAFSRGAYISIHDKPGRFDLVAQTWQE